MPIRAPFLAALILAATPTLSAVGLSGSSLEAQTPSGAYVPPAGTWARVDPASVGMSRAALDRARDFALEQAATTPEDLALAHQRSFGREPFGEAIGPFRTRGGPSGVIIRNGYIVAEWGDVERVDVTFSVAKSFLSATVGLAWDRGVLPDLQEPVAQRMGPIQPRNPECVAPREPAGDFPQVAGPFFPFSGPHNGQITWDHLLRQTSDWEGMLWCKPDWADRPEQNADNWGTRARHTPGTVYTYNDVRVNLLALAATNLWRQPLPQVLRTHVMDPIGASPTWRWLGYDNSWILLDGEWVQAVSGGSHWGGGMFIHALDMARFGLLHLRDGAWGDAQILSQAWLDLARTPGSANAAYGFMNFFLNNDQRALPAAPPTAYYHAGAGSNIIYVDPENDLVVVVRWIQQRALGDFIARVLEAVEE